MLQLSEYLQPGEHGISIDTDVALWMECRKFNNRPDLQQVMDFVIVNESQHSEFDEFRRTITHIDYNTLSTNALLDYWNEYERNTSQWSMAKDTINFITLRWISFVSGF